MLRRLLVTATVVAGASLPWVGAGTATAAPFSDPNASGSISLCDVHGKAMTAGRVDARPFIWTATSSFRPPAAYEGKGANAVLLIYQARQGVDPGNWNG